jgi:hypothetical protein
VGNAAKKETSKYLWEVPTTSAFENVAFSSRFNVPVHLATGSIFFFGFFIGDPMFLWLLAIKTLEHISTIRIKVRFIWQIN